MPSELEVVNDADLAALADEVREVLTGGFVGVPVKFNGRTGGWSRTVKNEETGKKNETEIGVTETFVIDPLSYVSGWKKWLDRKLCGQVVGRRIDGFRMPQLEEMPDRDQRHWPRDNKGAPRDPWQPSFQITMRDVAADELCTWVASSWAAKRAMVRLLQVFVEEGRQHPGKYPVCLLTAREEADSYGNVDPVLKVVDWAIFGPGAAPSGSPMTQPVAQAALPASGRVQLFPPKTKPAPEFGGGGNGGHGSFGDDMDGDSIPFLTADGIF